MAFPSFLLRYKHTSHDRIMPVYLHIGSFLLGCTVHALTFRLTLRWLLGCAPVRERRHRPSFHIRLMTCVSAFRTSAGVVESVGLLIMFQVHADFIDMDACSLLRHHSTHSVRLWRYLTWQDPRGPAAASIPSASAKCSKHLLLIRMQCITQSKRPAHHDSCPTFQPAASEHTVEDP